MSGGQIAALICAIILFLPGGCFLVVGIGLSTEHEVAGLGVMMLFIALVILSLVGFLGWVAFRRRSSEPGEGGP